MKFVLSEKSKLELEKESENWNLWWWRWCSQFLCDAVATTHKFCNPQLTHTHWEGLLHCFTFIYLFIYYSHNASLIHCRLIASTAAAAALQFLIAAGWLFSWFAVYVTMSIILYISARINFNVKNKSFLCFLRCTSRDEWGQSERGHYGGSGAKWKIFSSSKRVREKSKFRGTTTDPVGSAHSAISCPWSECNLKIFPRSHTIYDCLPIVRLWEDVDASRNKKTSNKRGLRERGDGSKTINNDNRS